MTKKIFVKIAYILFDRQHYMEREDFIILVNDFADVFQKANPFFDRQRFINACLYNEDR